MSKTLWWRVTERNTWEGETWRHYFEDGPDVRSALEHAVRLSTDLSLDYVRLSDEEALILANMDEGYMAPHWFGKLTKSAELLLLTDEKSVYKGSLRAYGEEVFS